MCPSADAAARERRGSGKACRYHPAPWPPRSLPETDAIRAVRQRIAQEDLTPFHRAELALKLQSELAKIPRTTRPKPWNVLIEMARIAGISASTLAKVKLIAAQADDRTKTKLRSGELQLAEVHRRFRKPASKPSRAPDASLIRFSTHHRQRIDQQAHTQFHRAELALALEEELAKIPLAKRARPWNIRAELARIANVSEGTLAKVKFIAANADEPVKTMLRTGELQIQGIYLQLRKPANIRSLPDPSLIRISVAARQHNTTRWFIEALVKSGLLKAYRGSGRRYPAVYVVRDEVGPALQRAQAGEKILSRRGGRYG